jgi:beta-glucosidase
MSDGFLHESLRDVDWGVATADTIAAPPPPPPERAGTSGSGPTTSGS